MNIKRIRGLLKYTITSFYAITENRTTLNFRFQNKNLERKTYLMLRSCHWSVVFYGVPNIMEQGMVFL